MKINHIKYNILQLCYRSPDSVEIILGTTIINQLELNKSKTSKESWPLVWPNCGPTYIPPQSTIVDL